MFHLCNFAIFLFFMMGVLWKHELIMLIDKRLSNHANFVFMWKTIARIVHWVTNLK